MPWTQLRGAGKGGRQESAPGAGLGANAGRARAYAQQQLERALAPVARAFVATGVTPNQISSAGVVANLVAALLVLTGDLWAAGLIYLLGGLLDILDGLIARTAKTVTRFGAFLDSTLDRISEGVVLAALAYHFAAMGAPVHAGLVLLAALGSFLVSYTRARIEGLGGACKVGLFARPERVILVAFGLITGWLAAVVYILLALTAVTVAQRIAHARNVLADEAPPEKD